MKYLFTSICVFCVFIASSQNTEQHNKKFDSICFDVTINISARDFNKSLHIADSLYKHSVSPQHKVAALMLSSELNQRKGYRKEAIVFAQQAGEIASKEQIHDWKSRIYGFLSTQYRLLELFDEGKIYLDKALKASEYIKDDIEKNFFLGLVYQEKALHELGEDNYTEAHLFVQKAEKHFNKVPEGSQKNFFLVTLEELYGITLLKLKQYDEALFHYNRAEELLDTTIEEQSGINGAIYIGVAQVYLAKKDYTLAVDYLKKAETIAEKSDFIALKIKVYEGFSEYYKATHNYEKSSQYQDKYLDTFSLHEQNKKAAVEDFVKFLKERNKNLNLKRNVFIGVSVGLGLLICSLLIAYKRKKKKDLQRFNEVLNEFKNKFVQQEEQFNLLIQKINNNTENKDVKTKELQISKETEIKIIEGLKNFERNLGFLQISFSLSDLASRLNTNTKYLSFVLNKYFYKDFNTYINELRINYIVEKIEKNREYRNYKISYLAEECGFSSHSKFSSVFKTVTGFSPSVFIEYVNKQTQLSHT
jgi:AraC-like DNA-binding protein